MAKVDGSRVKHGVKIGADFRSHGEGWIGANGDFTNIDIDKRRLIVYGYTYVNGSYQTLTETYKGNLRSYKGSIDADFLDSAYTTSISFERGDGSKLKISEINVDGWTTYYGILGYVSTSELEESFLDGDDKFIGSSYADAVELFGGNDIIEGNGGDDIISGGSGNDIIKGGSGIDTAKYSGESSSYTIQEKSDKFLVSDGTYTDELYSIEKLAFSNTSGSIDDFLIPPTHKVTNTKIINDIDNTYTSTNHSYDLNSFDYKFYNLGQERYAVQSKTGLEIDEITGVSFLHFSDQTLSLSNDVQDTFDQVIGIEDVSGVVFRLYNAAFARLPDAAGLENWINANDAGTRTYAESAQEFSESQEFANRYGANVNNTQFITTMYNNVLERDPDPSGLAHYQTLLANGKSRGAMLLDFSESPENKELFKDVTGLS